MSPAQRCDKILDLIAEALGEPVDSGADPAPGVSTEPGDQPVSTGR